MLKLVDIAQLQFGFYAKPEEKGSIAYLQAKHFDDWGNQKMAVDTFINQDSKNESHLLQEGDILVAGKGFRNFAWTYNYSIGPAIASSMFFVIKPDRNKVLPEFLTTLFNTPQTQDYFQTLAAGSSIPSIRKSELEAFPLHLPSIKVQQKIIAIKQLHYKDMELTNQIIEQKQKRFQGLVNALMFNKLSF